MLLCLGIHLLTLKSSCINFLLKSTTIPSYSSLWSTLTTKSFQSDHPLSFWTPSLTSPPLISEHDINLDATYINYILQCNKLPPNLVVFTKKHVLSHRNLEVVSCVVLVWGLSWGFRKDVRQVSVIWMLGWGICFQDGSLTWFWLLSGGLRSSSWGHLHGAAWASLQHGDGLPSECELREGPRQTKKYSVWPSLGNTHNHFGNIL